MKFFLIAPRLTCNWMIRGPRFLSDPQYCDKPAVAAFFGHGLNVVCEEHKKEIEEKVRNKGYSMIEVIEVKGDGI